MFTDIVDSTKLVEVLGEEKWRKLLAWHDRTLREQIEDAGGEVIKQTGDGYFAAFQSPASALEAAAVIQRALDEHEPLAPDVRIGVHTGGAFHRDDDDYAGQGVHIAARIGALAQGGEILVSRESLAVERASVSRSPAPSSSRASKARSSSSPWIGAEPGTGGRADMGEAIGRLQASARRSTPGLSSATSSGARSASTSSATSPSSGGAPPTSRATSSIRPCSRSPRARRRCPTPWGR